MPNTCIESQRLHRQPNCRAPLAARSCGLWDCGAAGRRPEQVEFRMDIRPEWMGWVGLAACGAVVGSFLNVVIHRLPIMILDDGERAGRFNLAWPASHCPSCRRKISCIDNIPLISFLVLRGRCRACGTGIAIRYPLVELLGMLVPVIFASKFGFSVSMVAAVLFGWAAIAIAFIDYEALIVPDSIVHPLLWAGLLFSVMPVFVDSHAAILGAATGFGSFRIVHMAGTQLAGKVILGWGDLKLFAAIGAWVGVSQLPVVLFIGCVSGSVVGISLILSGSQRRDQPIPFGPFLLLGALLSLGWGEYLVAAYWRIIT